MRSFPLTATSLLVFFLITSPGWAQRLHCETCAHHFGEVQVGQSVAYSFQLENTGTETLTINSVTEQGTEFAVGNVQLPAQLEPGAVFELPVSFTPTVAGHVNGGLTVASNALNSPLTLALGGTGQASSHAQLTATPSTISFGNVNIGTSETATVTLTASNGNVIISSDQTSNPQFAIVGLAPPVTIASGQSLTMTIAFTPTQSGADNATAQLISNAKDSPVTEALSGTGVSQQTPSAYLSWNAGGNGIAGYNIYRGTEHGGPYGKINPSLLPASDYTDYDVVAGDTYYYVATEVNNQGQESGYSNEAEAQIPTD